MSRPSFRPRPLDIHKKLPIVKSVKEFEDDEPTTTATRTSQIHRLAPEAETEVSLTPTKKPAAEIPIPQFVNVDTYETDYARTFAQPTSYLRGRGARSEIGEFIEYDLDNEDDDWLEEFNNERRNLTPEKFEAILFKLEVLDHKTRERSTAITSTLGSPIPVCLRLESAAEALQALSIRYVVLQSVYNYWKSKRERWQKPILRRLQPPPPVHDTNPYNVFRPREKAHRLHTRRMQRRENNVQSFEKLRQIRRNLDQTKMMIAILIKREEKKREVMENEVNLQRIQLQYRNEAQLVEDGFPLQGFPSVSGRYGVQDEYADSDDDMSYRNKPRTRPAILHNPDSRLKMIVSGGRLKQDTKRNNLNHGWLLEEDPHEPVLLFTKPLLPDRLAAAGIVPPQDESPKENGSARPSFSFGIVPPQDESPKENGSARPSFSFRGRIGRGGRIVFDRWNPLSRTPNHHAGNPHLATDANFPGG